MSATSAAYGCTCHAQRSRSPTFPTSFTATSAGTRGGQDTKKTPRVEENGRDLEHPSCFCCSDTSFLLCLQPKQPKLSLGWQRYCHFVGFLLTITTIVIYPSIFFLLFSLLAPPKIWTEGDSGNLFTIHSSVDFLVVYCADDVHIIFHACSYVGRWIFNFLEDIDKSVSFSVFFFTYFSF